MDYNPIARFLAGMTPGDMSDVNIDGPTVVFPSELELDRDQEKILLDEAIEQLEDAELELGRDFGFEDAWHQQEAGDQPLREHSFIPKRQLAEMTYRMRMEWRAVVAGGIFEEHNITVPITRRIVQQQHARANGFFFGTDPWFNISPVGSDDEGAADKFTKYARFKFEQYRVKDALIKAVENTFIRGEQVLKPTYTRIVDLYEDNAVVGIGADGEPILAHDGDYIFENDMWVETLDENQFPTLVLKRDRRTPHPGFEIPFELRKVKRRIEIKDGIEMGLVYYKDFICPLDAESPQTANLCAHLYDRSAFDIVHEYLAGIPDENGIEGVHMANVMEMLNEWQSMDGSPKSYRNKPRSSQGEDSGNQTDGGGGGVRASNVNPKVEIAEIYLYCDPVGDGHRRNIMLLLDRENRRPIYYNYVANVSPTGERPFFVMRIDPEEGRWHGNGQVDLFSGLQEFADLTINRMNEAQGGAGHIDIVNPEAVEEGEDDGDIEINGGDVFHLKKNFKAEDFFTRIYLHENRSENLSKTLEWMLQFANALGGVSSFNDNEMAGLETVKLATGIRNLEKSGQEQFAPFLNHMEPGITGACRYALMLIFDNLDDGEVFEFFENDPEANEVVRAFDRIDPEDVAGVDIHVNLELTRYKAEAQLAQTMQAEEVGTRYYMLPYLVQQRLRPLFIQQLKALQVQRADELIVPLDLMAMSAGRPGNTQEAVAAAGAGQPPPKPNL